MGAAVHQHAVAVGVVQSGVIAQIEEMIVGDAEIALQFIVCECGQIFLNHHERLSQPGVLHLAPVRAIHIQRCLEAGIFQAILG